MNKGISMIETLRDFIAKMDALGIEYMVTGSYAMSAYGEIRMTKDIDVVIVISPADVRAFLAQFIDKYYFPFFFVCRFRDMSNKGFNI